MSVKQLQGKLVKLKARIQTRQSELADLKAQHKDARAQLIKAKKSNPKKPRR
jgi:hypothetical protein